ncbi:collagen-like protein [Lacticaseibacillus pabuli]|uniref:Collagen-like protein n=1 Tax=Lacticaseibacillus pabuli TaxID=3025672 RepID=A0ABY7WWY7_9LACO|nr:collagen-like protein [Lacticaseibacillus sp. KACC 23028]WDF83645.1 collagen-like protein [Lacticaseibacillus sp. KACC 23028]
MANELRSVFTTAGMETISQVLAGNGTLAFTRGVSSVADWSTKTDAELQATTKLDDETQVTTIGDITVRNDDDGQPSHSQVNVNLKFMQNQIKADYAMRVVGLYASLETNGTKGPEMLYMVAVLPQPQWMAVDRNGSSVTVQLATAIGSTDQLNIILADDQGTGGVSQGTLSVFKVQLTSDYDKRYAAKNTVDDLLKRIGGDGSGNADPIVTQSSLTQYLADHKADFKGDKGDQGIQGLQGPQGVPGPQGDPGNPGVQGKQGPQGVPGVGAYTDYKNNGGTGTFDQFLATLKGAKGDKGDPGTPGAKGDPGAKGTTGTTGAPGKDAPQDAITAQQFASALGFKKAVFIKQTDYDKLATKEQDTAYFTSFDS